MNKLPQKIYDTIETFLYDVSDSAESVGLPFFVEFSNSLTFIQNQQIDTCAVNFINGIPHFHYNLDFIDSLPQKEFNFIFIHELYHLLWDHHIRVGNRNPKLSNIVLDMIINDDIHKNIPNRFVSVPKNSDGSIMIVFPPTSYSGYMTFESLYDYVYAQYEKYQIYLEGGDDIISNIDEDTSDENGVLIKEEKKIKIDANMYDVFNEIDDNEGQFLDEHQELENDNITHIENLINEINKRGFSAGDKILNDLKIEKTTKNILVKIKEQITNNSKNRGIERIKKISKPNRRNLPIKGRVKPYSDITINCILDTSGSMVGVFEKLLKFINRDGIKVNLIQIDTKVRSVELITNRKQLNLISIKGGGGTILQPAIDLVVEKYNNNHTLFLTDGHCELLNISKIKKKMIIVTTSAKNFFNPIKNAILYNLKGEKIKM